MKSLHYLTVQDFLWLNLQLEKQVRTYDFAKLEEACNYQYFVGGTIDIPVRAGRVFGGFVKLAPFLAGNPATGFIGAIAFLRMNGYDVSFESDAKAKSWLEKALEEGGPLGQAFSGQVKRQTPGHGGHAVSAQAAMKQAIEDFPNTIIRLQTV